MKVMYVEVVVREVDVFGESREVSTDRYGPFDSTPNREDWAQARSGEAAEWLVSRGFVRVHTTSRWIQLDNGLYGGLLRRNGQEPRNCGEDKVRRRYITATILDWSMEDPQSAGQ